MVPSCRRWLLFILATAVLVALVPSDGLTHDATGGRRLSSSPHAAKPRSTALDGPAASRAAVTRDRRATAAHAASSAAGAAAARRTATANPSPAARSRAAVAAARARVRTESRARPAAVAAVIDRAPNPTTLRQRLRGKHD